MILVDIGHTRYHIWENGYIYHRETPPQLEGEIYYISVNPQGEEKFLQLNPSAINLEDKVNFFTLYDGLGIDRKMACKTIIDGVVIDAGTAITIDVMEKGIHNGGIIMAGLGQLQKLFQKISPKLEFPLEEIDFSHLPLNTREAVMWGTIGAVVKMIGEIRGSKPLYFTGGDGKFLQKIVGEGVYEPDLVFLGMIRTIEEWKFQQNGKRKKEEWRRESQSSPVSTPLEEKTMEKRESKKAISSIPQQMGIAGEEIEEKVQVIPLAEEQLPSDEWDPVLEALEKIEKEKKEEKISPSPSDDTPPIA